MAPPCVLEPHPILVHADACGLCFRPYLIESLRGVCERRTKVSLAFFRSPFFLPWSMLTMGVGSVEQMQPRQGRVSVHASVEERGGEKEELKKKLKIVGENKLLGTK